MFVDLDRLEDGYLDHRFEIDRESPVLAGFEAEVREPLILDVQVRQPSGGTYVMTAELRGTVMAPCRRCLKPTEIPIEESFRVVYQEPGRDAFLSEEPGDDDIVWLERRAHRIELDPQVRDRLFIDTERFPLCRPDCPGICPVCGQDLAEGTCDCRLETVDTRWKALEGIEFEEES